MKNISKRIFSLLLAFVMVLSVVPMNHAHATENEPVAKSEVITRDDIIVATPDAAEETEAAELPDFSFASSLVPTLLEGVTVDEEDVQIIAFENELNEVRFLNAEGETVLLTEEQKANLVGLYQKYIEYRNANADVLGVQVPFFLSFNDNEDSLGVLGEIMSLANIPMEAVRTGMVDGKQFLMPNGKPLDYSALEGMMVIFLYTDTLGVQFYGNAIKSARDEALKAVKDSGAQTEAQKQLVLNDWLAENVNFDMPYIMGEEKMKAEQPTKHRYYDAVYDVMYDMYAESIEKTFRDKIDQGMRAELYKQFYTGVAESMVVDGYLQGAAASDDIKAYAKQAYMQVALEQITQAAYDAAYDAYDTHEHELTATWTWAEDLSSATVSATCATGLESYENVAAVISEDVTASTVTCTEAGVIAYVATAEVAGVVLTDTKTKESEKLGHDFDDNFVCTRCHTTAEGHAHKFVTLTDAVAATCAAEGSETYACDCGETVTNVLDKLPHTVVDGVCTACGATFSETPDVPETIEVTAPELAVEAGTDADADRYAQAVIEAQKAELEAQAAAAAEAATDEELAPIINTIVYGDAEGDPNKAVETDIEKKAAAYGKQFVTDNAEALAADARAFVVAMLTEQLGAEVAAGYMVEIDAQYEGFIYMAETEGIEMDPVNYPGYKMTIEQIVEQQMDAPQEDPMLQKPDGSYMTPNEAVPVFADQAATESTVGVLQFWEGAHFGALGEGKAVCLGYADAYSYLVQCMHPEYYTKSGNYKAASDWIVDMEKLYYTNGKIDINKGYFTDFVRIHFNTDVTMFGVVEEGFNSDHFWNAARVDGKWYYVDPCYTDVFVEVMMRDRAETDGNVDHMYFMFSHNSATSLYEGYYNELLTLYETAATDASYEDAWTARIVSDTSYANSYVYYVYSSRDLISLLNDYNGSQDNQNGNMTETDYNAEYEYKLVRHKLDNSDVGEGDSDYETLIEFNYVPETEDTEEEVESVARVYNPTTGAMEENAFLTALYAEHYADTQVYPSLAITCALDGNMLYFNLSNYLLAYNITTGEIVLVNEYNSVSAKRDKTNAFGAMAFSVVGESGGDLTVEDHPIAGIIKKDDGKLYVSIATNFSFISGKETNDKTHATPEDPAANGDYGYVYEESNYNPKYNSYGNDQYDNSEYEQYGYEKETNDNDEFMWTANFVETQNMRNVAVKVCGEHTFEAVEVAANCEHNAYTVNICATCGVVENGTYAEVADTIHNHHYIYFAETYYTKNDAGNWNSGECYVCAECGFSIEEPTEPQRNQGYEDNYEEQMEQYEKELAIWNNAVETAGHEYSVTDAIWAQNYSAVTFSKLSCEHCKARKSNLDCLLNDNTVETTLKSSLTVEAAVAGYTGDCTEGAVATYVASGRLEQGGTYYISTDVKLDAGNHAYEAVATWNLVVDEEGNAVLDENGNEQYTVDATLTCAICGDAQTFEAVAATLDAENSVAPTCTEVGANLYTVTFIAKNASGAEIGSATSTLSVEIPANGHDFVDGVCSVCGEIMLKDPAILSCYSKLQTSVKVTWTLDENADGYELWRTTTPEDEESWALVKTVKDGTQDRYTNQDLEKGTTYYYKVRAYIEDAEGVKTYSNFSNVDYMPAAVVWDGPYSNATFRIRLRWNEIGGAHGYQIWRLNEDGETWSVVKTLGDKDNVLTDNQGATTAYSNTGLESGKQYTYKMRAFMIPEEGRKVFGAYSDEFTIAVMPETPEITVTSPKATRAEVEWDEINGAAGYQVWMQNTESDAGWAIVKSITDGTTTYTKYDLKSGTTYEFKVRAYTEVDGKKTFGAYSETVSIKVK